MTETEQRESFRISKDFDRLGKFGERLWGNIMKSSGFTYVPLCDLPPANGKGPRMQGTGDILPDFDSTTKGRRFYLDSKVKKHYAVFRNACNESRHGVDRKCYEAYTTIAIQNRSKSLLGIVELFGADGTDHWSGTLLVQSLSTLGYPRPQVGNPTHRYKDMVLWPRDRFIVLAEGLPALTLVRMSHEVSPEWNRIGQRLADVVALPEVKQQRLFA